MDPASQTFRVIQARSRLRKLLPILPPNEEGKYPFNYPALEGYLFALHIAPFEIGFEEWGYHLDRHLPDPCYQSDHYRDDIVEIYYDIEEALESEQYFKAHTLSIPSNIPAGDFSVSPMGHWHFGFSSAFELVLSELKRFPKKTRKRKAFHTMRNDYVETVMKLAVLVPLKVKMGSLPASEAGERTKSVIMEQTLNETFAFVLENLHITSLDAIERLNALL